MKVSKRSLIMSIAVLCVCALSLTAASFAWFSASKNAEVKEINLKVDAQSELEISIDGGANWGYTASFNTEEVQVVDLSTGNATDYFAPTDRAALTEAGKVKEDGTYTQSNGGLVQITVYFRTKATNMSVKMGGSAFNTANTIASAMRVAAVVDNSATFFANANTTYKGINSTSGDTTEITPNVLDGTANVTIINTLSANKIDTVGSENDDYKYGKAVISYWVEGTDDNAINANAGVKFLSNHLYFAGETGSSN